ncbi:growth-regulating factor 1-like [Andrographis paniculata]|uniref:growth-regulating factor 1-like n=1 Tax=Andrographis paniculata TaxID=175694 RepID=UPI0021E8CACF|nr:growth-regulating factor 1-like [Andrographis paniculata]
MDFAPPSQNKQTSPDQDAPAPPENPPGSENLKRHRPIPAAGDGWSFPKLPRPAEPDYSSKAPLIRQPHGFGRSNLWPADDGQKMLSFSSSTTAVSAGGGSGSGSGFGSGSGSGRSITFSQAQDEQDKSGFVRGVSSSPYANANARMRGPFTPLQWMELEQQALIYKYLVANVPVPPHLLAPLRRPAPAPTFASPAAFASHILGWGGPYPTGNAGGSNDPEPGRCRRTDGKKWRCSRDAVPDQKYCERHINRGRHRSRKPVEGQQTGHAVAGPKVAPIAPSSSPAASVMPGVSVGTAAAMHQHFGQHPITGGLSTNNLVARSQAFDSLSLLPNPTVGLKSKDAAASSAFAVQKQDLSQYEEPTSSEFGLFLSEALLNSNERLPYIDDDDHSNAFLNFDDKDATENQLIHQFIDDWPKDQSHRPSATWPEEMKSDWTQLSMSIPAATEFSSSSASPAQERSAISIPRPGQSVQMSLGMSNDFGQLIHKQPPWFPVTWGNPMGGPLGEVLINTTPGAESVENNPTIDAGPMKTTWRNNSPQMELSPSGVLHKSNFVSLSNSCSPRSPPSIATDDKNAAAAAAAEKARLCNEFVANSAAM